MPRNYRWYVQSCLLLLFVLFCQNSSLKAEERKSDFANPQDLKQWELSGDTSVSNDVQCNGHSSLKVSPGGKAVWKLRDANGSGTATIWIKEAGVLPDNPKERSVGIRWGVMQSDGRVLVLGTIYAPYLDGGKTYAAVDSDQKSWFGIQYLGEKRSDDWNKWEFVFDPQKGLSILRDGKKVARFDWNKTQIKGFAGIVAFGDSAKSKTNTLWIGDVSANLGTPMAVAPTPPAPPKPVTPETDPVPETKVELLESIRNQHPRLLFTKKDLPAIREWLKTDDGKQALEKIESVLGSAKPPQKKAFLTDATDGQRQGLWRAPTVGIHYLLTNDEKSKNAALAYMKFFLGEEHWETTKELDAGMSSANIAIGAALLYDWLYDELDPEFRAKYRDKLLTMARRQYYGGHLNGNKSLGYWQGDPANNHRWHRNAGMSLCLLAAAEEGKDDDEWILGKLKEELDYVDKWLPEDGSTHEGPGYMIFGLGHLILGMQAADNCLGTSYLKNDFYKNASPFILSSSLPGFKGILAYGDCSPSGGIGSYANSLYFCSALNNEGDAIDSLRLLEKSSPGSFWLGWLDVIWKRQATPIPGDYKNLAKTNFQPDMGVLNIRNSWDADAVAAMFKCSPPGGYTLNRFRNENNLKYINVAHDDFDANSFILFNNGQLTAQTDGYSHNKRSSNHNTILVNGVGQLIKGNMKEGLHWNQPGNGDLTKIAVVTTLKNDGDVSIIEGEASGSYPAVTKGATRPALKQYRRSFIWVKGKYVLVLDAIESEAPAEISWLMQSKELKELNPAKGTYQLSKDVADCFFQVVCDKPTTGKIVESTASNKGKVFGWQQLQLQAKGNKLRFASVYNPWQQKDLKVEMKITDENNAVVTVTGDGFEDVWQWQKPEALFTPSLISGQTGGKTVTVTAKDKAGQ